jgi:hypothetical protein
LTLISILSSLKLLLVQEKKMLCCACQESKGTEISVCGHSYCLACKAEIGAECREALCTFVVSQEVLLEVKDYQQQSEILETSLAQLELKHIKKLAAHETEHQQRLAATIEKLKNEEKQSRDRLNFIYEHQLKAGCIELKKVDACLMAAENFDQLTREGTTNPAVIARSEKLLRLIRLSSLNLEELPTTESDPLDGAKIVLCAHRDYDQFGVVRVDNLGNLVVRTLFWGGNPDAREEVKAYIESEWLTSKERIFEVYGVGNGIIGVVICRSDGKKLMAGIIDEIANSIQFIQVPKLDIKSTESLVSIFQSQDTRFLQDMQPKPLAGNLYKLSAPQPIFILNDVPGMLICSPSGIPNLAHYNVHLRYQGTDYNLRIPR